jgi:hypothetical protein
MKKQKINILAASMLTLGLAACGGGDEPTAVTTGGGDGGGTTYSISGTVSGLTVEGLTLTLGGSETLTIAADSTALSFTTKFADAAPYEVTVATQPTGLLCSVTNGSGTIAAANITDVAVTCDTALALTSLALTSSVTAIEPLQSISPFTLTGTFADESITVITTDITWSSSDEAILTIDNAGAITGIAAGSATVTATFAGQTATFDYTVTKSILSVAITSDSNSYFAQGETAQLSTTVTFVDNTTSSSEGITWSSDNNSVATIDNSGVITPLAEGAVTITATIGSKSSTLDITVIAKGFSRIEKVQSYSILPSKIVSIFKVFDGEDKPVSGLAVTGQNTWKANFKVEEAEDGDTTKSALGEEAFAEVKPSTGLKLIQPTVLVVDISASISDTELQATLDSIQGHYLTEDPDNVGKYLLNPVNFVDGQSLALVIFDGIVTDWFHATNDPGVISQKIQDLKDMIRQGVRAEHSTTNLYAAVQHGLGKWTDEFTTFGVTEGSLILITDGVDEKAGSTEENVISARGDKNLVTVFVDESTNKTVPAELAILASESKYSKKLTNFSDVGKVIKELGDDINAELNAIYVLEYVTPKRNGTHNFTITYTDGQSDLPSLTGTYIPSSSWTETPREIAVSSPDSEIYGTTTKGYLNVKPGSETTVKATTRWTSRAPTYAWELTNLSSTFDLSTNITDTIKVTAGATGSDILTVVDSNNLNIGSTEVKYELEVNTTSTVISAPKRQLRSSSERVDLSAITTADNTGVFLWQVTGVNGANCNLYLSDLDTSPRTSISNQTDAQIIGYASTSNAYCVLTVTDSGNDNSKNKTYFAVGNVGTPLSVSIYDPDAETNYDFETNLVPSAFSGDWTIINDTSFFGIGDYQLRSKSDVAVSEMSKVTLDISNSAQSISFNYKTYRGSSDEASFKINGVASSSFTNDEDSFFSYNDKFSSFKTYSYTFTEEDKANGSISLEWNLTRSSLTTTEDYRFVIDNIVILNDSQ